MTAEDTARSQIGRKIGRKIKKRQCGEPSAGYLHILVVDFSLADSDAYSWLGWRYITRRMDEVVKMLADWVGTLLPYDVVIPAVLDKRQDRECCFDDAVILDHERDAQIRTRVKEIGLDQECKPPELEPLHLN